MTHILCTPLQRQQQVAYVQVTVAKTGGPLLFRTDLQVQDVKDLFRILHESGTGHCAEHLRLTQHLLKQSRTTLPFYINH